MQRNALVIMMSLLVPLSAVQSQAEAILKRGVKVRVVTPSRSQIGYVDTLSAETLSIHERMRHGGIGLPQTYRRDFLKAVDVVRPRGARHTIAGGVIGMMAGAAVGFVIGASIYDDKDCGFLVCSATGAGGFVAAFGAVVGLPLGMMASALSPPLWEQVNLSSPPSSSLPVKEGLGRKQ